MDTRRDFLKTLGLVPMAILPFSKATDLVEVPQTRKSFDERGKYLDYTERDWMKCKLVLIDSKDRMVWAPPITKVTLTKNPFRCDMYVEYNNPPIDLELKAMRFVDKDRRMLFQPKPFRYPVVCRVGDTLRINYNINLD